MTGDGARAPGATRTTDRTRLMVIAAIAALASIGLALGALWASGVVDLDGGVDPALAQRPARAPTTTRAGDRVAAVPSCRTPLSPESPLRLWIAGDSLAGSLGPSLGAQTAATGIVQPVYDSRVSSGLSTPDFFDWPKHAAAEIQRLDPEVVVFIIGANDWRAPNSGGGEDSGAPAWRSDYARLVQEMLDVLEGTTRDGSARRVYWIGSPPLEDSKKDAGARQVDDVARSVIEDRDHATYVDAYDLFSGRDGKYTATLPGVDGEPVRVRADDGIHFTPEGGDLLADQVYRPLAARCDLDAQAVPGAAKQVIRTKGATEVAGTNRTSASTPTTGASTPPPSAVAPPSPNPPKPPSSPSPSTAPTTAAPSTSPTTSAPPSTDSTAPTTG